MSNNRIVVPFDVTTLWVTLHLYYIEKLEMIPVKLRNAQNLKGWEAYVILVIGRQNFWFHKREETNISTTCYLHEISDFLSKYCYDLLQKHIRNVQNKFFYWSWEFMKVFPVEKGR